MKNILVFLQTWYVKTKRLYLLHCRNIVKSYCILTLCFVENTCKSYFERTLLWRKPNLDKPYIKKGSVKYSCTLSQHVSHTFQHLSLPFFVFVFSCMSTLLHLINIWNKEICVIYKIMSKTKTEHLQLIYWCLEEKNIAILIFHT